MYTVGQRHGFTITAPSHAGEVLYVTERDVEEKTITVDKFRAELQARRTLLLAEVTLNDNDIDVTGLETLSVQTRYRQTPLKAQVTKRDEASLEVTLHDGTKSAAVGQSCVLYVDDRCPVVVSLPNEYHYHQSRRHPRTFEVAKLEQSPVEPEPQQLKWQQLFQNKRAASRRYENARNYRLAFELLRESTPNRARYSLRRPCLVLAQLGFHLGFFS